MDWPRSCRHSSDCLRISMTVWTVSCSAHGETLFYSCSSIAIARYLNLFLQHLPFTSPEAVLLATDGAQHDGPRVRGDVVPADRRHVCQAVPKAALDVTTLDDRGFPQHRRERECARAVPAPAPYRHRRRTAAFRNTGEGGSARASCHEPMKRCTCVRGCPSRDLPHLYP